jgi:HlyD family secretion protein
LEEYLNKKGFIIIAVVLILLVGGYFLFRQFGPKMGGASASSEIQTTPAVRGSLEATVGATGTVRTNQSAVLAWQTSGKVEQVNVSLSDQVVNGDILASLEQMSLPQSIILAQADLVTYQKQLDDLYATAETTKTTALSDIATYAKAVRDAQYQLENYTAPTTLKGLGSIEAFDLMKKQLDAASKAFEPYKYLSQYDKTRQDFLEKLNDAQSNYDSAVRRLDYEYQLQVAEANMKKARKQYEDYKDGPAQSDVDALKSRIAAAQAVLDNAYIKAPFAGTITDVEPKPGDLVSSGVTAFRVDDLSRLLLDVEVSEVDINRVQVGQDATMTFDAILGKEYHGKVVEVAPVGNVVEGVVNFTVTVELTDADDAIKSGMTAAVNIVVSKLENVLLIPNRAVRLQDSKRVVYVMKDGKMTPVPVTLGASSDTDSELVSGDLKEGDLIVLNPPETFGSPGGGGPPGMRQ